jgi:NAD(P)-dependent dehydrogenase (short-subunit alcohol dehydrogenase family)
MAQDEDPGTVLVTGAARRLGRVIALDFATRGWRVAIHYRDSAEEASELAAEIVRDGGFAAAFGADLARLETIEPLMQACAEVLGAPTCLINNAARFDRDALGTVDGKGWQAALDVNLRAPVFLTQAFAKTLPDNISGHVINIIDQKVLALDPEYFSYTIAKSGLWVATRTMAQALAPRIRVNAVAPGPVLRSQGQSEADFEREARATLLGKQVSSADVTAAIRFLLDTPSITGQMIALDGGQHLAWKAAEST